MQLWIGTDRRMPLERCGAIPPSTFRTAISGCRPDIFAQQSQPGENAGKFFVPPGLYVFNVNLGVWRRDAGLLRIPPRTLHAPLTPYQVSVSSL